MNRHYTMSDTAACDLLRILASEAMVRDPIFRTFKDAVRELNGVLVEKRINRRRLQAVVGHLKELLSDYED